MRVLDVYQKDTFVVIEMSLDQVQSLIRFLNKSTVTYNGEKEPEMVEASEYVTKIFFDRMVTLVEGIKPGFAAEIKDNT